MYFLFAFFLCYWFLIKRQADILSWIKHPNLVTLIGACSDRSTLMYEYLPNGTLEGRQKEEERKSFLWKERVGVAKSTCTALVFLHNTIPNKIAHDDLKPSSILFDEKNECKLGDFGISRSLKDKTDTGTDCHNTGIPKGTSPYMDPQFDKNTPKLTATADRRCICFGYHFAAVN